VLAAVRLAAQHPDNQSAKDHLTAVMGQWDAAVVELKKTVAEAQQSHLAVTTAGT
jgi:cell division protein ZapA (FtsZ GTPase activity inhibitor)